LEGAESSKPNAGIFEYACAALDYREKGGMIMVGDSLSSDIRGGINFGIDTCWVNLAGIGNMTGIVPTYEVRSLAEIARIL
jgi:2-haloacid dehalogenase